MDEKEEYFGRLLNLTEDIKFTKKLQWNNVYFAILLDSALIALGQTFEDCIFRAGITGLIAVSSVVFIIFQCHHSNAISSYRKKTDIIDHMLHTGLRDKIDQEFEKKNKKLSRKMKRSHKLYKCAFVTTIVLAALIVLSVIWYEDLICLLKV